MFSRIYPFSPPSMNESQYFLEVMDSLCIAPYSWIVQDCTKSSITGTCWVCSVWANHLPRAQIQTSSFQTYPTLGRSTEALHAVHSFSLFYGKGNDVQIVTLLSEKESLFSALLLVTRFKIQKIPTKQAHNENQQLPLQQAFKYNICVKNKQNKLNIIFLYQQLYSCMGT